MPRCSRDVLSGGTKVECGSEAGRADQVSARACEGCCAQLRVTLAEEQHHESSSARCGGEMPRKRFHGARLILTLMFAIQEEASCTAKRRHVTKEELNAS
ncbi:hypothetical protein DUI87_16981 [Hirundo rustica rustica]|uniref:Uncharacterized protein n=1 Tax=Hirundo rustica rustica TaxID=333673 RepID=A0A3M0KJY1_HIRRU|nr:hypothetical protein DUI87_16981 [Hirundo rustica rustica]